MILKNKKVLPFFLKFGIMLKTINELPGDLKIRWQIIYFL